MFTFSVLAFEASKSHNNNKVRIFSSKLQPKPEAPMERKEGPKAASKN
jgi:hypothetical protein